ncbi:MAG: M56 family metallopeptidase [Acidobacteriota bacterium]
MTGLIELATRLTEAAPTAAWVEILIKATALLLAAWVLSQLMSRASAAARHRTWTAALLAVLALPLLSQALPGWQLPISTPPAASAPAATSPLEASSPSMAVPESPSNALAPRPVTIPSEPTQAAISLPELGKILPLIWALGTLILVSRLVFSSLAASWLVRSAKPVSDVELLAEVDTLRQQLGLRSAVKLVEHPRVTMPMAWGLWRPAVLLPDSANAWTEERRRVVLLHELAHLKRWDCQTLMLARLVTALHWLNPLAWLALRRLQTEREHACDDLVLSAGTPGADYAQHLLDIARAMRSSLTPNWALVAMARPSELEGRLLAILDPELDRDQTPRIARWGVLLIVCLLLPLAALQPGADAQQEPAGASPQAADESTSGVAEEISESLAGGVAEGIAEGIAEATRQAMEPAISARVLEALTAALSDEAADNRAQAAHALGSVEDATAVPALALAVREDASETVREQAAWSLGMIEDASAVPALRDALSDPSESVREQAAWSLGMIESPDAVEALGAALGDPATQVREQAAWALGMIESSSAVPKLITALDDAAPSVREQAAWALGLVESPEAVTKLSEALADPSHSVRHQAAWALGMIESHAAVDALTSTLANDASAEVREQAAWALGMIEDEAALDVLLDAMSDEHLEVRQRALWAVGQITG